MTGSVVSVSFVTSVLLLTRGFLPVFSARSPRHRISVRRATNFRAHKKNLCARKFFRLPHSALMPSPQGETLVHKYLE